MLKLKSLGAGNEVGRSAFVLEKENHRILLDYGMKVFSVNEELPQYPLNPGKITHAIISHSHLDHIGHVPALFKDRNIKWHTTPPTYDIAEILWEDSIKLAKLRDVEEPYSKREITKAYKNWNPLVYNVEEELDDFNVKMLDAGHIAGSSMIEINTKSKSVLYTGDLKLENTQLHEGAKPRKTDILIIEGTYWNRNHPDRKELERMFIEEIKETLDNKGNVLLPAFAVGRTQELVKLIRNYDKHVPIFVDGMGVKVSRVYSKYPNFLKDYRGYMKSIENVTFIESPKSRDKVLKQPGIIVSTAGMMEGGPALGYLTKLNENSKVIITGYCLEHTNGRRLLEEGKVKIKEDILNVDVPVVQRDFSAHAGRSELLKFIEESNAEKIVVVHSDNAVAFAEELKGKGFDAVGIKVGEEISLGSA